MFFYNSLKYTNILSAVKKKDIILILSGLYNLFCSDEYKLLVLMVQMYLKICFFGTEQTGKAEYRGGDRRFASLQDLCQVTCKQSISWQTSANWFVHDFFSYYSC